MNTIFKNTNLSPIWLLVRIYIGYEWLTAGWAKVTSSMWVGGDAGTAVQGFLNGALTKTTGAHPDVPSWFASFITNVALPHSTVFSYLVAYGETLVGVALILGLFTGIAAFFGAFMNFNYLFAGTISINPAMIIAEFLLILAWQTAGYIGLDRFVLPKFIALSTPDQP